ncbi:unnamed protein product, partial [marine sediment metagenome]
MATALEVINSARYDVGDYGTGVMWDNTELLNYLNRMVEVINSELVAQESELVEQEETDINCVANQKYVDLSNLNSGLWTNIIDVWIGQDLIEQISVRTMRYKRIFRNDNSATWATSTVYNVGDRVENNSIPYICLVAHTSGTFSTDLAAEKWETNYRAAQPYYWALQNQQLMFEQACPSSYSTLKIYYNVKQPILALDDDMPFQDRFNETFRSMLVMYAEGKKDGNVGSVNN